MADFGRGIKAGIVSGIIYGIISVIFGAITAVIYWETILSNYAGITVGAADMMGVIGFLIPILAIAGIIGGIIFGLIFGLIYAAIYNSLPGSTSVMKAIVLALIGWVLLSLGMGYGNLAVDTMYYVVGNVIFGLIGWIIWGYLLGVFWDKFGAKPAPAGAA